VMSATQISSSVGPTSAVSSAGAVMPHGSAIAASPVR
jgi:hypothetical protein